MVPLLNEGVRGRTGWNPFGKICNQKHGRHGNNILKFRYLTLEDRGKGRRFRCGDLTQ